MRKIRELYSGHFWELSAVVAGVLLRIVLYLQNDSLFRDEASLALNLASRTFSELAGPLDYSQSAPLIYLWLLRAAWLFGGGAEMALRLPSLLAGIFALAAFAILVRRSLGAGYGAAVALWLFAVSFNLVLFSCVAKQYSLDVLAAVSMLLSGYKALKDTPRGLSRFLPLCLVSAVCIPLSNPAVFMAGGVALALAFGHEKFSWRPAVCFGAAAAGYFMLCYSCGLAGTPSERMQHLWAQSFAPQPPDGWYLHALRAPFDAAMGRLPWLQWGLFGVCCVGAVDLWRGRARPLLALCAGPLALALCASFLKKYPFGDRLLLFSAPGLLLLAGRGLNVVRSKSSGKMIPGIIAVCLAGLYLTVSAVSFLTPVSGVREALGTALARLSAGEVVLADQFAAPAVLYYNRGRIPEGKLYAESDKQAAGVPLAKSSAALAPRSGPVWLIAEASGYARRSDVGFVRPGLAELRALLEKDRGRAVYFYAGLAFAARFPAAPGPAGKLPDRK